MPWKFQSVNRAVEVHLIKVHLIKESAVWKHQDYSSGLCTAIKCRLTVVKSRGFSEMRQTKCYLQLTIPTFITESQMFVYLYRNSQLHLGKYRYMLMPTLRETAIHTEVFTDRRLPLLKQIISQICCLI